ncbi:B2 protein-like [Rhynchophorus ferrugineus]|uniref:B2 protein-like n=1 Tax=Rhynchophorus ferrugineus TaxID=354439 RepID=UPI003FCD0936
MKYLIVLVLGLSAITAKPLTDEQKQNFRNFYDGCVSETNVDKAVVEKAHHGEFENDDKLPFFFLCMSKKIGFRDANNVFQPSSIKEKLSYVIDDAALVDKLAETCFVEKQTPQESAMEAFKCYFKHTGDKHPFY